MKKKKLIWTRGYNFISRLSDIGCYKYSITECRIAAMAFEAGWKAGKRDSRRKVK